MCISTDIEKNSMVLFVNIGENDMQVGDLVRHKKHFGPDRVGVIYKIGSPNPIARILWADGQHGALHIKSLEVISESR